MLKIEAGGTKVQKTKKKEKKELGEEVWTIQDARERDCYVHTSRANKRVTSKPKTTSNENSR